ncbi:MAG: hypothetical protein QF578_05795 [Alphaproteobacteria bacterium]|nr:hypothetical protein [Alphaproteobacteria bacterium]
MDETLRGERLTVGLIETGLSVSGMTAVLTPLALWVAWSELVFYATLVIGGAAFLVFWFLAWMLSRLPHERPAAADPAGSELLHSRGVDWDALQEDDAATKRQQRSLRNEALRNLRLTLQTATLLILLGLTLLALAWRLAVHFL